MAAWHMIMTIVGMSFFIILLFLLSCAENEFIKPFVSFCLCGYDNIEKEKRRRRQLALQKGDQRNEELKQQNRADAEQYNPSGPIQGQNNQQSYLAQPHMADQPYNPVSPPQDPYANAYQSNQALPVQKQVNYQQPGTKNAKEPGPPVAQKKGFFDKAKDKVKEYLK